MNTLNTAANTATATTTTATDSITDNAVARIDSKVLATMSIEDMLSLDINAIEEVVDFSPLPTALYAFNVEAVSLEEVGSEDKKVIQVVYNITDVHEMENEAERDEVGELPRKHTENYFLEGGKTAFGLRAFRTIFRDVAIANQCNNISETMEAAISASGIALIQRTTRKRKDTGEMATNSSIVITQVTWN